MPKGVYTRTPRPPDRVCPVCQGWFHRVPSAAKASVLYCSTACRTQARGAAIVVPCICCQSPFKTHPSRIQLGLGKFCSRACAARGGIRAHIRPLEDRLFDGVERVQQGCWLRQRNINPRNGYSQLNTQGRTTKAHRIALEQALGSPIPPGFSALHTCDVRNCIRNDDPGIYVIRGVARPRFGHLWLGTHDDNMADMAEKGRGAIGNRNGRTTHPEAYRRGVSVPGAKLTDDAVRAMRQRYALGNITLLALSQEFGVSFQLVSEVVRMKRWTHVR